MISLPSGTHIWIAAGITDLRRGFTGLSAVAQTVLERSRTRACFRLPRPARRSDQAVVVGWRRTLSIRQASGTRPFHLAAGRRGRGIVEPRATVDAIGRHRLAAADPHERALGGRLTKTFLFENV